MNASAQQVSSAEIRPFRVDVPETDLTELRKRINATRWPDRETVPDATQGVQLATTQALARYWATEYEGIAYGFQMGLRPQTLYGIADSPVGLAAYFLDHDARSYELISRVFQGQAEGLTRDDILDNITITWLTNTALSGARLYWEYWGKGYFNAKGVSIPVAVSVFPDELYPAPRSWAERAYPNLIHYNTLPKGGHFAAWEQPKFLSEEMRAGFRSLRK